MRFSFAVHPRLRGELSYITGTNNRYTGSSPLTRGTHIHGANYLLF